MIFALGQPGQKLRMYHECKDATEMDVLAQPNEVFFEVPEIGAYDLLIAENGKSLIERKKSREEIQIGELEVVYAARRVAYPDIGDQLGALWQALSGMDIVNESARAMIAQIAEVKARFPKPVKEP